MRACSAHVHTHAEGEYCPVGLIWGQVPSEDPEHFYTISELDQLSISVRLNLSKQNFVREGSKCPQNFQWKGIIVYNYNYVTYKGHSLIIYLYTALLSLNRFSWSSEQSLPVILHFFTS